MKKLKSVTEAQIRCRKKNQFCGFSSSEQDKF